MSIVIEGVSKAFGTYPAVKGIDLNIPTGDFVALLGPSGSGKTTLLRLIAGLEGVDEGRVFFHGMDYTNKSVKERKVGFVFQHLRDPLLLLILGDFAQFQTVGEILIDRHVRPEIVALEDHCGRPLLRGQIDNGSAVDLNVAGGDVQETAHGAEDRGFTAAGRSDQGCYFFFFNCHIHFE